MAFRSSRLYISNLTKDLLYGEAEIHINEGISISEASRKIGVTQQTHYHFIELATQYGRYGYRRITALLLLRLECR